MRVVGIKVLKNKLSEYVKLAARGETVLVTDRDRVVAELVPPREGREPEAGDERFAELVRRGTIVPASVRSSSPPPAADVQRMPLAQILEDLDADRADR
jgi:antitoxin (DNA-binding transcriptional repressor) of toxin-antitoxin stability system